MQETIDVKELFRRYVNLDDEVKMYFFPQIFGRMQSTLKMTGKGREFFEGVQDILDDLEEEKKEAEKKKTV